MTYISGGRWYSYNLSDYLWVLACIIYEYYFSSKLMPSSSNHEHILSINTSLEQLETTVVLTRFILGQIPHSILRELYFENKICFVISPLTLQIVIPKAVNTVACIRVNISTYRNAISLFQTSEMY